MLTLETKFAHTVLHLLVHCKPPNCIAWLSLLATAMSGHPVFSPCNLVKMLRITFV